ncbi:hypothetical protein H2248_009577 [Termitomyces sp. 'cryptogamus']|nr:hypothetical protein H2248_009577 [Termitomyces sp. 'cryptogamus']
MTSRLDRLLLLLDTGSTVSVRNTAAKQLAQLAVKSVTGDVALNEEDLKSKPQHGTFGEPSAWAELMAVVARIIPYLHSKSFDTRSAASVALSHIFSMVPLWKPSHNEEITESASDASPVPPTFPNFSVQELILQGKLLLASSGKEFVKPTGILSSAAEVKKARKEAMGRLGLEFLDGDDMDLDKEFAAYVETDEGVEMDVMVDKDEPPLCSSTPSAPSPSDTTAPLPDSDVNVLSARERNRLKRKRKPGNSAFVSAQPPPQVAGAKYTTVPTSSNNKARLISPEDATSSVSRTGSPKPAANGVSFEKVVIDPTKGGAVSPKASQQSKALDVKSGVWVWDGVVKILEVDLFSAAWEVRHGAAMALRELLKVQGQYGGMRDGASPLANEYAHERWCNDLAANLLCVFVLDRFGDFVSDQVVAPVRETVSQTLASLLIHMPRRSLAQVHSVLLQMIQQNFDIPPNNSRPRKGDDTNHVWEVRHAGLLGLKYEVAVRGDLFEKPAIKQEEDMDVDEAGREVLRGVVDVAILGLGDPDDDVRSVAASCLLPVAGHLVDQLPESLGQVLLVLWRCLRNMKDDLSSSVGAVMDLLGKLVSYEQVINILANDAVSLPLATLAPTLFPFFRHTIPNVRLAVVTTLSSFMAVSSLSKAWITTPFLRLLIQNLIVEERSDIRDASLAAWKTAISIIAVNPTWMYEVINQELILDWYSIVMTPVGVPLDPSKFYHATVTPDGGVPLERHNVDKNMLAQDPSLITPEITLKARVCAATALAYLISLWPELKMEELFKPILTHYLGSASMLQKFLAAVIAEEWARQHDLAFPSTTPLIDESVLAKEISQKTLAWLQATPPPSYHEMAFSLSRIHADCISLLQSFSVDCKLPLSSIPFLGNEVDTTGTRPGCFTIETAQNAVGPMYSRLKDSLGRTKKRELLVITEKRSKVVAGIDRYIEIKAQHDIRIAAAFASAFVAFKSTPDKVSPVVKGIMNGIKNEENIDLQSRSAAAVSSFIKFCAERNITQPPDKIVKNLCTFLCQDIERTPTFAYTRKFTDGVLSFQRLSLTASNGKVADHDSDKDKQEESNGSIRAQLSRRGAKLAFDQLSATFGPRLLNVIPSMWQSMAGGLLSALRTASPKDSDLLIEKQFGQDVIDSFSVLEAVTPTFHQDLWPRLCELFPMLDLALRSRFAIIRQSAAKCFATICDVMTSDAMHYVVERLIPLIGDPLVLAHRQGVTELVYHIVNRLDIKALPYVIFMVVPILGRMSDTDEDIRSTATNTFASLVKMVPLEAGLPDPPGFSEELLKRRETERQFLVQLLDGNKVEHYAIPTSIKAELRKYQQDGVNWLAFLAKYQLHGILCDDMGLGKTLQSICILAGKHHERSQRYQKEKSPDSVHLPSLIVCPPTLTGHWYYEILKYTGNLRPVLYTGNARERTRLLAKLKLYDVVITSYEVVRNDISNLESLNWLYCVLDEGHVIKNAKTKLTKAVKCIRAQHRLILSGTPIQNNVLELWSLFDFLMPGFLGTEASFNERFSKPILSNRDGKAKSGEAAALALEALHKQVLPFLLRRLKEDVLNDLPPKIIQDYYCELSDLQKHLYDDFSQSKARISAENAVQAGQAGHQHVFQSLQYLRKLCNHPALVLNKDKEATDVALAHVGGSAEDLSDILHAPKLLALRQLLTDCGIGVPSAVQDSAKSELIDTVDNSSSTFSQHRVLIFCQMKQMLDIIENDLFKKLMPTVTYMRLDGGTESNKRHAVVQTFNSDPSIDCLLLTTHVGGLGLTLTGADTVIFVEHDWNPMKDLQAMDRAHRIGQKRVVNVYRLITKGTLEEKIMGLAEVVS